MHKTLAHLQQDKGNDLLDLVDSYSVGFLKSSLDDLLTIELANKFFDNLSDDLMISSRCEDLARKLFLCDVAANTIHPIGFEPSAAANPA